MKQSAEFQGIQNNRDLRDVSFVFRNLYKTGSLSASEILYQTGTMMPKYRNVLHAGAKQISTKGWSLSKSLEQLFPPQAMPAIRAGEESGRLTQVFEQIWTTAKTQEEINKVIRGLAMPAILIVVGFLVSLGFTLFIVPNLYRQLARGMPLDYEPNAAIQFSLLANDFFVANWHLVILGVVVTLVALIGYCSRPEVKSYLKDLLVRVIVSIKPIGLAYSNLQFGVMAQYLQIVSLAGLDADRRIDLVIDVLPVPLRKAIVLFRSEMLLKGITAASQAAVQNPDDPRHSPIQWPHYLRLAFSQADEGNWEGPMREFGDVMLDDGKENLKTQIGSLQILSIVIMGVFIIIPIGLLYSTLGEVLMIRMRAL